MVSDSERTIVRTYIPAYQKEQWQSHSDELDMSQSEFVRTMVQAGRSGFEPPESETNDENATEDESVEGRSPDATPGGEALKDRVQDILADGDYYKWDELLAELTDDIEDRLEDALQELQSENEVQYSGRHGGYVRDE
jgi:gas vesicle protein